MIHHLAGKLRYHWRRSRPRPDVVAAVDLGASAIRILVGQQIGSQLNLIGYGEASTRGLHRGVVTDAPAMSEALGEALEAASVSADVRLQRAFLNVSGHHVEGLRNEACFCASTSSESEISGEVAHTIALSKAKTLPKGRCVIHHLTGVVEHEAITGAKTESTQAGGSWRVSTWHVHADQARISDVLFQAQSLGLHVEQMVLSGLASGAAVTSPEEREAGVLVLDYGAGAIDYALYQHGHPIHAGQLAVGGNQVTNDLAIALRLRREEALAVQRMHGRARVGLHANRDERVWLDDRRGVGARTFPLQTIEIVCAARVRETLEIVRKKLGDDYRPDHARAGVVVTGGMVEMEGLTDVAADVFAARTRVGTPAEETGRHFTRPCYSTVLGVLLVGCELQAREPKRRHPHLFRRLLRATDYVLRPADPQSTLS